MSQGEVRQSQLITTYGPGAMVDLPDHSVVIGGLNLWNYGKENTAELIDEPRLVQKLRQTLQVPNLVLQKPPIDETGPGGVKKGGFIKSPQFPNWFVAQLDETITFNDRRYRTRPLVKSNQLDERNRYMDINREKYRVVPVRFVQSCPNGHLSDVSWREFVHKKNTNCRETLWLDEAGAGNDFAEIFVRCPKCNIRRPLSDAKQLALGDKGIPALGYCNGERPWLGSYGKERCESASNNGGSYPNRLLVRSASNAYFPEIVSAISIPKPIDKVREVLIKNLKLFENINTLENLKFYLSIAPDYIKEQLLETNLNETFEALESIKGGNEQSGEIEPLKVQELKALIGVIENQKENYGKNSFEAEKVDLSSKSKWFKDRINRVLKVHKLREVVALLGFTRLEPVVNQIDGDPFDLGVKRASIDNKEITWLPAVENMGEGIFIGFDPNKIEAWLSDDKVEEYLSTHRDAFKIWNKEHGLSEDEFGWPGGAYLMLHSLSHLLITQAALDCGYSASSIKERIYSFSGLGYGILLYTGGSGSEGTLGGLVGLADNIDLLLKKALERGKLCSNDPFCSQHKPNNQFEKRYSHGAACHSCELIAETSCERKNEFLDRSLVVPTLEEKDAAFFD